ncbi:MAG: hypothetical protein UR73_C0001G0012 [candidate division WS6 bacterium GW2011_GWF1_35_23]|uniref:DNA-directed DNA polymerase n=1 Tax=candidate division WS6 bacterium GW2011_GWF1_35_23 TaxID=1619097 RepID=A0A0G0FFT2_9BACT|nr:MAG: hypothetical protein UR73_C0001G0012 [candidate division WS6 bacterium GW2011_GWF1_35_23]
MVHLITFSKLSKKGNYLSYHYFKSISYSKAFTLSGLPRGSLYSKLRDTGEHIKFKGLPNEFKINYREIPLEDYKTFIMEVREKNIRFEEKKLLKQQEKKLLKQQEKRFRVLRREPAQGFRSFSKEEMIEYYNSINEQITEDNLKYISKFDFDLSFPDEPKFFSNEQAIKIYNNLYEAKKYIIGDSKKKISLIYSAPGKDFNLNDGKDFINGGVFSSSLETQIEFLRRFASTQKKVLFYVILLSKDYVYDDLTETKTIRWFYSSKYFTFDGSIEDNFNADLIKSGDEELGKENTYIIRLDLLHLVQPEKLKPTSGGFFPFENTSIIDLSRYQISKINEPLIDENENCLIYSMKQTKFFSEDILKDMRLFIKQRFITITKLKNFAKEFNLKIYLRYKRKDGILNRYKIYNEKGLTNINLCVVKEHYFLDEEINFTRFALKNYNELKDKSKFNEISRIDYVNGVKYYRRGEAKKISSYDMINILFKNNLFTPMCLEKLALIGRMTKSYEITDIDLENLKEKDFEECVYKEKTFHNDFKVYFADTETYLNYKNQHIVYLICVSDEKGKKSSFYGEKCINNFLNSFAPKSKNIIYFHNLGYDFSFIFEKLTDIKSMIKTGTHIKSVDSYFYGRHLYFKDSLSLIPAALRDFPNLFNFQKQRKELFPYEYYNNEENLKNENNNRHTCEYLTKYFSSEEDKKEFLLNCDLIFSKTQGLNQLCREPAQGLNQLCREPTQGLMFDTKKYAIFYCNQDVNILRQGMNIMKKETLQMFGLNVNNYISIPQIANDLMLKNKVYENVFKISGSAREFIQKTILGGRCMSSNNEMFHIKNKKIQDFDAVSLYPSAMDLFENVPNGKPKILSVNDKKLIKDHNKTELNKIFSCYFVEIKITEVNSIKDFPLLFNRDDKNGVLEYINEIPANNLFLNNVYLDDLIKHHNIKYEVIRGLYFNEGFNNQLQKEIEFLFEERLRYKIQQNPRQLIIKLLMNSIYGKTIMKPIKSDLKVINSDKFNDFVYNNYNDISKIEESENKLKFIVKLKKQTNKHFSMPHVGSLVLANSKKIMNQLFYLAYKNNLKIFYQDTDSIHILEENIKPLSDLYLEKYNKILIGKNMGQFHSDFDLSGAIKNIHSKELIILGKKSYLDILEGQNDKNETLNSFHIRLKGIPKCSVKEPYNVFLELFNGEKKEFSMNSSIGAQFIHKPNLSIFSETKNIREILFNKEVKKNIID